jgi:hypothetical protein
MVTKLSAMKGNPTLRNIPAVVFSSSSLPDDPARALALSAAKYFQKSSDWQGFLDTAQEICAMVG